jgi:hypothetical protein
MTRKKSQPSPRTGLRGPEGAPSSPGGRPSTPVEAAAGRDQLPRDHRGFPMKGAALQGYRERQADINAAMEARQMMESLARTVMVLASRITGGLPGPDAVRAIMNTAGVDGLRHGQAVVRAAGYSPSAQQAAWQAEAPVRRQASATVGGGWASDPDHDPRVMQAITAGAPASELNRIRQLVAIERQEGRAEQARRSNVMWRTRDGVLTDDTEPVPFQTSVMVRDWNQFPDHAPPTPPQETAPPPEPSIWAER